MGSCKCNGTLSNSGKPNCDVIADLELRQIHVPLFANDGTRNSLDPQATINAVFINALLNNIDPSKRWYPLPLMKNITDERGDNITEEFDDQSIAFIAQGSRAFAGIIVGQGPHYLAQLQDQRCVDFGSYSIDKNGAITGLLESDGLIYPIPVDKGSWSARYMKKTDKATNKIMINYNYSTAALDEQLETIPSEYIIGIDLRTINGLYDLHLVLVGAAPAPTTFTADITTDFGNVVEPDTLTGLLIGDFDLYNVTDALAIVITTVTETPAASGRYVFVYPAQTVSDVMRVTLAKTGYDASEISDGDHNLPAIV